MSATTDLRAVPQTADHAPEEAADTEAAPAWARPGIAAFERLGTAYVLFESGQQLSRFLANRRAGMPVVPLLALLPVARGLAAARLLLGRPESVERVLLEALVAGAGAAIPACPGLGKPDSSVLGA